MTAPDLVLLDVNETLSDLSPLRARFEAVGAPPGLLDTWFASVLRDAFALSTVGAPRKFPEVAAAVLLPMVGSQDAVQHVLDGMGELVVHPDVRPALQLLADAGVRAVPFTNGGQAAAEAMLERSAVRELVERVLSVDDAGRWKPHRQAYDWALQQCDVPPQRAALVAVHPWDVDGAQRADLAGGWVDRSGSPYPAVFLPPDVTGRDLPAVAQALLER